MPPALIPRDVLFDNPEKSSPELSADGRSLAYLAPDTRNVLQVWLRAEGQPNDRVLTQDPKRGIRSFFWTYQSDELIYLQDADGDENFHLYCVNVRSGDVRDITPFPGVRAQLVALEPSHPGEILVGLNKEDPRKHDVYRVRLSGGEIALEARNPGNVIGWTADSRLEVRAALAATPDGGHEVWHRSSAQAEWQTILVLGPDEQGGPVEFSEDGKTLYLISSQDANAQRLVAWDAASGKSRVLAEDPSYDVSGVFVHPARRTLQACSFYKDKLVWKVLDKDVETDFEALQKAHPGELHLSHGDLADEKWIASYVVDDGPVTYYLYDRKTRKTVFLFSQRRSLEGLPLVSIRPVSYKARDGLQLHAYLTLPKETSEKNLPVVLLVHGGPWARDHWGFNPMAQWLANRGYAVFQVNYRGSTGYGKDFLNAGNREWAGKMHDDLIDGIHWIVAQGIADPKRIAIMGGSYGGYATLVGLTFTPEVFACGVDIVGPSNIITLVKTIPPYWEPLRATFARRVGVVDRDEAFMKSRSPLFFVDRIVKPLLIGQGANDPRVKQAESDQIVEAMRKNKKPVEYIVYSDEGHGFARPQNRMHFYARVEAFLAKHLGGRAEPATDLAGHTGQDR
jgi:dipeptidyl aminopeptidase/acylaminoacyl peptidase